MLSSSCIEWSPCSNHLFVHNVGKGACSCSSDAYLCVQEYPTIGSIDNLAGLEIHTRARLPLLDRPEVCGLHPLADTFCRDRLSRGLFDIILSIQPKVASLKARYETPHRSYVTEAGCILSSDLRSGLETAVLEVATEAVESLPDEINKIKPDKPHPITEDLDEIRMAENPERIKPIIDKPVLRQLTPLQAVLYQEVQKFNKLLQVVRESLTTAIAALKGEAFMSDDLEAVCSSLAINKVPLLWQEHSYVSERRLGSWMKDLSKRVAFFTYWISLNQAQMEFMANLGETGGENLPTALSTLKAVAESTATSRTSGVQVHTPGCYWLPAFFYPQGSLKQSPCWFTVTLFSLFSY